MKKKIFRELEKSMFNLRNWSRQIRIQKIWAQSLIGTCFEQFHNLVVPTNKAKLAMAKNWVNKIKHNIFQICPIVRFKGFTYFQFHFWIFFLSFQVGLHIKVVFLFCEEPYTHKKKRKKRWNETPKINNEEAP
jgi:hypothetical protein